MDAVEDALERVPEIKKELAKMEREDAAAQKAAEEAAKKAVKVCTVLLLLAVTSFLMVCRGALV